MIPSVCIQIGNLANQKKCPISVPGVHCWGNIKSGSHCEEYGYFQNSQTCLQHHEHHNQHDWPGHVSPIYDPLDPHGPHDLQDPHDPHDPHGPHDDAEGRRVLEQEQLEGA